MGRLRLLVLVLLLAVLCGCGGDRDKAVNRGKDRPTTPAQKE